ncbi:hypothetical protein OESDEN_05399 [Oesophagostomum dentatum]|uniref:Glycosyl hydrolase family 38 C-terminal domain-containing protein n=1 Tax=Oesophagostomum dentatum TaxID=61180 RepID=A0A0B1TFU9_OESDE|nr:hypothetical protein OESDEN_05399 [Oesophagostomum dentatum]
MQMRSIRNFNTRYTSGVIPRFLTRGPIQDTAHLFCPSIYQKVLLKKVRGSLGQQVNMLLRVDIRGAKNTELLMRIETNLDSPRFYADSAGLQLLRRQRYDSLEDAANFYPMPSAAVLEDNHKRITVVSNVAHGVSPLNSGMDIALDRILNQDDGKGLGSGPDSLLLDMVPVEMRFSLLIENIEKIGSQAYSTYHTSAGHLSVQNVLYPPVITFGSAAVPPLHAQAALPCNFQLLTVRTVANEKKLLTIYNSGTVCNTNTTTTCSGDFKKGLISYLRALAVAKVQETNLAGTPTSSEIPVDEYTPFVEPYKFLSLLLSFSN